MGGAGANKKGLICGDGWLFRCTSVRTSVCVCVCARLYLPSIVDKRKKMYMQTWTHTNHGRPRLSENS